MRRDILISAPARKYAKAFLEVAIKQRNFSTTLENLESFQKQLQQVPMLRTLFISPAIPPEKKKKILEDLAGKLGMEQLVVNVLNTLIHRQRLNLLEQVVASAERQFLERQGIVVVEVASARKLKPQEEERLRVKFEAVTGKRVQLENTVEPSLVGGIITRIGTTFYDGSVEAQLQQLKAKIIEGEKERS